MAEGKVRRKQCMSSDNILLILMIGSVVAGIALGVGLKATVSSFSERTIMYIGFPGDLFLRMLKLLILPLIVSSLMNSLTRLNASTAGKLSYLTGLYFLVTTLLAVIEGIALVKIIRPGQYASKTMKGVPASCPATPVDSILDLLRNVFPSNMIRSTFQTTKTCLSNTTMLVNQTYPNGSFQMVNQTLEKISVAPQDGMNILGLVFLAICFGVVINSLGDDGKPLADFFLSLEAATMKLVTWVIWYGPVGIMFLIAQEIIGMDDPVHQVEALGMYMATVCGGLLIHGLIVLPLIFVAVCRSNPFKHFLGASQALVTALGTDSSSATLPVTIRCMEDKCGYDRRVARFVCPLGATVNMNGSALYEAIACIYITQVLDKELGVGQLILVSLTATLAAVGAAGIPQAGLVTLLMVLTAVDLPPEYAALIIPVDWLLDRVRTTVNVWGDTVGCAVVNRIVKNSLPPLDSHVHNHEEKEYEMSIRTAEVSDALRTPSPLYPEPNGHSTEVWRIPEERKPRRKRRSRPRDGKVNKSFQVDLE